MIINTNEITQEDKLFYFEKNFFTLDGLWMIETEKEIGFDRALKLDLIVWKKLLKIIFRRIKKYLKIETKTLKDLIKLINFRWLAEEWDFSLEKNSDNSYVYKIKSCPYNEIMKRNPERHDRIASICKDMCIPFYKSIIEDFNSKIILKRDKYIGLGDKICNFELSLKKK